MELSVAPLNWSRSARRRRSGSCSGWPCCSCRSRRNRHGSAVERRRPADRHRVALARSVDVDADRPNSASNVALPAAFRVENGAPAPGARVPPASTWKPPTLPLPPSTAPLSTVPVETIEPSTSSAPCSTVGRSRCRCWRRSDRACRSRAFRDLPGPEIVPDIVTKFGPVSIAGSPTCGNSRSLAMSSSLAVKASVVPLSRAKRASAQSRVVADRQRPGVHRDAPANVLVPLSASVPVPILMSLPPGTVPSPIVPEKAELRLPAPIVKRAALQQHRYRRCSVPLP